MGCLVCKCVFAGLALWTGSVHREQKDSGQNGGFRNSLEATRNSPWQFDAQQIQCIFAPSFKGVSYFRIQRVSNHAEESKWLCRRMSGTLGRVSKMISGRHRATSCISFRARQAHVLGSNHVVRLRPHYLVTATCLQKEKIRRWASTGWGEGGSGYIVNSTYRSRNEQYFLVPSVESGGDRPARGGLLWQETCGGWVERVRL